MSEQPQTIKEVKASVGDMHISPRKVRLVTDLLKNLTIQQARLQLSLLSKKAAHPILKLLNSAAASARHNFDLDPEKLRVKNITVNQGNVMKRYKPRAQGRASPIRRRTARVEVILIAEGAAVLKKARKPAKTQEVTENREETEVVETTAKTYVKEDVKAKKVTPRFVNLRKRLFNRKTNA
jgi:large subunit ribosomal protein L22